MDILLAWYKNIETHVQTHLQELDFDSLRFEELAGKIHNEICQGNELEAISFLQRAIESKSDLDSLFLFGRILGHCGTAHTFLIMAIMHQRAQVAEWLLDHGASPNAANSDGYCPLHYAAKYSNTGLMNLLMNFGANPAARTPSGQSVFAEAIYWARSPEDFADLREVLLLGGFQETAVEHAFLAERRRAFDNDKAWRRRFRGEDQAPPSSGVASSYM